MSCTTNYLSRGRHTEERTDIIRINPKMTTNVAVSTVNICCIDWPSPYDYYYVITEEQQETTV